MQSNHEHPTRVNIKYRSHSFFTNKKEKNRARDLNDILGILVHSVFSRHLWFLLVSCFDSFRLRR